MNEPQRNQQVAKQLQALLKDNKIRTKKAVFCVPGQTVFVRRFTLPKATPEHLHRMVRFEARQQIPFPLDKTIMEYQVFEREGSPDVSVLLVAIKREYILNFMRMVRRTGLTPVSISVSSLALHNFHELNNSQRDLAEKAEGGLLSKLKANQQKGKPKKAEKKKDKEKKKKGKKGKKVEEEPEVIEEEVDEEAPLEAMGFEEIQAYINLGASLMDLAIPKPGPERMIGFPRTVPLAGNEMDRVIRDRLELEDSNQARRIKEEQTVVLSTDYEIEGESEGVNQDASEAVTGVADRIVNELRRSLDYYISQPDGVAIDSLVVSGGLAQLRYLPGYFEEKLGVPVEMAEVKHSQIRLPDDAPESFSPYVIAAGLALQGLGLAQNHIDFLPEEIKNVRGLAERRLEVGAMAAMLLVIILMGLNVGSQRIAEYERAVDRYRGQLVDAARESKQIDQAQQRNQKTADAYQRLARAAGNRDFWLDFLQQFVDLRPGDVLIESITMRTDGNVIVRGKSPTSYSVTQFLNQLENAQTEAGVAPVLGARIMEIETQYDQRFRAEVQAFTIVIKTLQRDVRVRLIGGQPRVPAPEQPAAPAGGGGVAPTRPGMDRFAR